MDINFALDITVARRRSGLSQHDVGHLLGVDRSRISKLERGTYTPTATDIAALSIIYDLEFPEIGQTAMPMLAAGLAERLRMLPNLENYLRGTSDKAETLKALAARLQVSSTDWYDD